MKPLHTLAGAMALALAPSLLAAQATKPLPLKHAPQPTTAAITPADLMTRLYTFADDSMMGRRAGTLGNVKGTNYIAAQAAKIGLVPAGENGTYFQTIPLKERSLSPTSRFLVGGTAYAAGSDWGSFGPIAASLADIPAVYGGTIGDSASFISPEQAAGKLVVVRSQIGRIRRSVAGLEDAAAIAVVAPERLIAFSMQPRIFFDDPVELAGMRPVVFITPEVAAKLFTTPLSDLTPGVAGKSASLEVTWKLEPSAYPARNVVAILPGSDPTVSGEYVAIGAHNDHIGTNHHPVDHDSLRILNHLLRPDGADDPAPTPTPEEQAKVNAALAAWRAAHPHTARLDSIANGADDDGSGTVSVLAIAQKLAAMPTKPRRSILFVWHTGEELGLLGSTYFTNHPTVPRDSIVAQLNMDMVGRGAASDVTGVDISGNELHGGPNYLQLVGSRRLSTELGDLAEQVNRAGGHNLVFDYSLDANGHPANIYCRSDHYEYARYGIPIIFFTTGLHSDYHQVTDEPEYINYEHMARVDRFIADLAVHVANLDHRPVVDQPLPDPHGTCRQ